VEQVLEIFRGAERKEMKSVRVRGGDPRHPKTALIAFLFLVATLLFLVLLHFAVVTDH
jgi:hypothetical protein